MDKVEPEQAFNALKYDFEMCSIRELAGQIIVLFTFDKRSKRGQKGVSLQS